MPGRIDPNTYKRPSASGIPTTSSGARSNAATGKKIENLNMSIKNLRDKEQTLTNDINDLRSQKNEQQLIVQTGVGGVGDALEEIARLTKEINEKTTERKNVNTKLNAAKTEQTKLIYTALSATTTGAVGNYQMSTGTTLNTRSSDTSSSSSSSSKNDNKGSPDSPDSKVALSWQYNPPMVKAAYLSPTGLQRQDGTLSVSDPGSFSDAMNAWTDSSGARGAIQMSRYYPYYSSTDTSGNVQKVIKDSQVYGFKFLYNPTTVSMGWGVSTAVDVAKLKAGALTPSSITDAASNSSITFSLVLNRMLDMNYVGPNGISNTDAYPFSISQNAAKGIYERGTMHDLEYLFRAVNGKDSDYNSGLNGKTSDFGWLNSFPVELHLGYRLRYLVRVTQISVEHKIFNERMVPIFSTVDVICKRLPDFYNSTED